jgi:hypothetical protein
MSRPSKKHHFVSAGTATPLRRRCWTVLHICVRQEDRPLVPYLDSKRLLRERFNTVSVGDGKWNFEDLFREVDARSARLVAEAVTSVAAMVTQDDRIALSEFIATQLLRT